MRIEGPSRDGFLGYPHLTYRNGMTSQDQYRSFRSFFYRGGRFSKGISDLLAETPLEITVNSEKLVLIMCTPGMMRELVAGFLFTEGIIDGIEDLEECTITGTNLHNGEQGFEAHVFTKENKRLNIADNRSRISYSACGVCGKTGYSQLNTSLSRVKSRQKVSMDLLKGLPSELSRFQPLYDKTGGAHAAVLFDGRGKHIAHSEDMGRHNAVDKVIGRSLLEGIPLGDKILLSSGRASLEMILKTARAGLPFFVAMSRPTSRAVDAARFYNITLVDMAKDSNRIYTHARRIKGFRE